MNRTANCERRTNETKIQVTLGLDGTGKTSIHTGIGFFDHMLEGFARHGLFDLTVAVSGDLEVDCHHTIEDTGIVLGQAIREAVGDKAGIRRYGHMILPMDETLALIAVDLSGRACLGFDVPLPAQKVGTFDTELVEEFFLALVREAALTLHIRLLAGANTHHVIEGIFKGVARALREACEIDPAAAGEIPSTKGTLGGEAP